MSAGCQPGRSNIARCQLTENRFAPFFLEMIHDGGVYNASFDRVKASKLHPMCDWCIVE
jgi:hypothetical protein